MKSPQRVRQVATAFSGWLIFAAVSGPACTQRVAGPDGGNVALAPTPDAGIAACTDDPALTTGAQMIVDGRQTFRYDTFGDEDYWGGTLGLHRAIAGSAHGGVGPGLSPKAALDLGL